MVYRVGWKLNPFYSYFLRCVVYMPLPIEIWKNILGLLLRDHPYLFGEVTTTCKAWRCLSQEANVQPKKVLYHLASHGYLSLLKRRCPLSFADCHHVIHGAVVGNQKETLIWSLHHGPSLHWLSLKHVMLMAAKHGRLSLLCVAEERWKDYMPRFSLEEYRTHADGLCRLVRAPLMQKVPSICVFIFKGKSDV
jgi:hypothetical protein